MKSFKVALLAAVASVAMGGAALAQDEGRPLGLTFNAGGTSDYIFRGISQSDENPAVFGGADITIGGIGYAGVWASTVDFNNGTDLEYDIYAGIKPVLGPVTLDLGVIYYGYVDSPSGSDQDYVEFKAAASVPVGPGTLGAAVYYSDEFFGDTGNATYYEVNGSVAIPETKFSLSGALGRQELRGPFDYTTWNLGVGYAINDTVGLDLRYHDSDEDLGDLGGSRVAVSLKAVF